MTSRSPTAETSGGNDHERLVIEAAKMDPRRFAELYEQNFDRVYAFVARRAGPRGEAEDVTAEVFHHALANLGRFEWRGVPFAAWLLQIARNALADRWQRAARERGEPSPETGDPSPETGDPGIHAEVERWALFAELVSRLPDDQQRVIRERFVEQKSIREIARELARTEGAVKQLQFRALGRLRAHMRDVHVRRHGSSGGRRRWRRSSPTRTRAGRPPIRSWPNCSASPRIYEFCPAWPSRHGSAPIS